MASEQLTGSGTNSLCPMKYPAALRYCSHVNVPYICTAAMKWLDRVLHKRSKPSSTSLHVASPLGEVLARYYQQRNEWLEDSRRAETLAILDQNRPERAHGQRIGRAVYIGLGSFAPCKDAGDSGVKVMSQLVRFLDIVDHCKGQNRVFR